MEIGGSGECSSLSFLNVLFRENLLICLGRLMLICFSCCFFELLLFAYFFLVLFEELILSGDKWLTSDFLRLNEDALFSLAFGIFKFFFIWSF